MILKRFGTWIRPESGFGKRPKPNAGKKAGIVKVNRHRKLLIRWVPLNQVRKPMANPDRLSGKAHQQASDDIRSKQIEVNEKWEGRSWRKNEKTSRVKSVEREVKRMLDIKIAQKWPLIVDDRSLWRKTKIAKWSNQGSFHFWKAAACQILYNQIYWQNRRYQLYYTSAEAMSRMHEVP